MARLRRAVCAFYFPSREQVRSLTLCVCECPSASSCPHPIPSMPGAPCLPPQHHPGTEGMGDICPAPSWHTALGRHWEKQALHYPHLQVSSSRGWKRAASSLGVCGKGFLGWHCPTGHACRFPLLVRLARRLGIQRKHCLTCGTAEQKDFTACITAGCKGRSPHSSGTFSPENSTSPLTAPFSTGLYCSECYKTLNNICSVCMAPLSYPDSGDEEK